VELDLVDGDGDVRDVLGTGEAWYAEKFDTPTFRAVPVARNVAMASIVSRSEIAGLGQWIRYRSTYPVPSRSRDALQDPITDSYSRCFGRTLLTRNRSSRS